MPARPKLIGDKDRLIPPEQRQAVLDYLEDHAGKHAVARMVILLADRAGLRVSEAVKLQRRDADVTRAPFRLLLRGAKHRAADHIDEQPIDAELAAAIRAANVPATHYVVGGRDEPYTRQHALVCVKAVHAACGLASVYGIHSWRHGYGTRIYANSGDLMRTMRMMRHRSLVPTQKYIHLAALASDDIQDLLDGPSGTRPKGDTNRQVLAHQALRPRKRATMRGTPAARRK